MKLKLWTLALLTAACYILLASGIAGATETEVDSNYYTLYNQGRYTIIHEVRLNNYGLEPAFDIHLTVPLMDEETPEYSRKLREQIDPWPTRLETDEFGRRVAYYYLAELPAGAEAVFVQKYVVDAAGIRYSNAIISGSAGYDEHLESHYLLPSPNIESDHEEIIAFAKQAAGRYTNPYDVAKSAFSAVNFYMTYEHDDLIYHGALSALRRGKGVCEDYSNLYVAVLRALGIAARQQGGYLYLPGQHVGPEYLDGDNQRLKMNGMRHTWVEFYIPGQGWVIADPTFTYTYDLNGVVTKFIDWNYFASINNERRYLFFIEGSVKENEGKMWVGSGSGYVEASLINGYLMFGSQAAYYNDLPGHWAEEAVMRMSEREEPLLQGMGNGMFGVDLPMTRAQLVVCLQRLLKSPSSSCKFLDLSIDHWAYRDIGAAQQAGWINGYPDGSFRPENPVSRAELAQILVKVFELKMPEPAEGETADIPDFHDLGRSGYAWADEAIITLAALGISEGRGNGYYYPAQEVTRAEFATFLDRIISQSEQE